MEFQRLPRRSCCKWGIPDFGEVNQAFFPTWGNAYCKCIQITRSKIRSDSVRPVQFSYSPWE